MILDIKTYPAKILSKKTKKIGAINAEIKKLADDMVETLYAKGGVGLAANQVGERERLLVFDAGEGPRVLINPRISRKRGKQIGKEGCLSFPGLELEIKRPMKIEIFYSDKEGERQKDKLEGLAARIICHEIDHLDGKTILDRISFFKRMALKKKLKKK